MVMDSKLRSFQVENMAKYDKFREIQQSRNKKIGQRLNELIEKEVKEADPNFKDNSPIKTKELEEVNTPNVLLMDQAHALPAWREFLLTLTKKQHSKLLNDMLAIFMATKDFDECVDHD
jgi:hypothetical protein